MMDRCCYSSCSAVEPFATTEDLDREVVREGLFNQRLASRAENYLADLRAQAIIEIE